MKDKRFDDDSLPPEDSGDAAGFAELLEQSLEGQKPIEIGQKVMATILQIGAEWVFLDVGQKGEGVLAAAELAGAEGDVTAAVGDRIEAYFLSRQGGELRFTTRMGAGAAGIEPLAEAYRSGIPVDGRIDKEIKGGFEVWLSGGVRAFCPFSQAALRRPETPAELVGQTLPFRITQLDERGRNIVVSHRILQEEERQRRREALRDTLKEGMRVRGTVTSLRDFGAFVDIGGIEGLLPISEVSYGRVERLDEVLHVGQELELVVKRCDWAEQRFTFSLRDTLADPWSQVGTHFRVGGTYTGTVSRLAPFGAFVTLEDGVDGLIHISRLGEGRRIRHPQEVVKPGQSLTVTIEKIELEARRISLVPATGEAEPAATSYRETPTTSTGMGTLGELLKAAQAKKKR